MEMQIRSETPRAKKGWGMGSTMMAGGSKIRGVQLLIAEYRDPIEKNVAIMHIDVDSLTAKRKTLSPYETSSLMFKLYSKMSDFFLDKKSLAFFMGGDNFMVVSNSEHKINAHDFINQIKNEMNLILNCGIGTSKTGRDAAKLATKSLDTIREIRDSGKEKPEVYELK